MIRAFHLDLAMLKGNAPMNLTVMVILELFIGLRMQSMPVMFAGAIFMAFPMLVLSLGVVDELGAWGTYRLSLPISRRDCVTGRYLTALALIVTGLALALVCVGVCVAVGALAHLIAPDAAPLVPPAMIAPDSWAVAMLAASASTLAGMLMFAVITPLYYRFGLTKLTRLLPVICVGGTILAAVTFGGLRDRMIAAMGGIARWMGEPAHMALVSILLLAVSAVAFALSAAVSIRVYETREV